MERKLPSYEGSQGAPSPWPSLLSLPEELLDSLLLLLPLEHRASYALVCQRLAAVSRSRGLLWGVRRVRNKEPAALLEGLQAQRVVHVEELYWGPLDYAEFNRYERFVVLSADKLAAAQGCCTRLADQLEVLQLCVSVEGLDFTALVRPLRRLQKLQFTGYNPRTESLCVVNLVALRCLPHLKSLSVYGHIFDLGDEDDEPDPRPLCIPPALTSLSISAEADGDLLELCASRAPGLRQLTMVEHHDWLKHLEWGPLEQLRALTSLTLDGLHLSALPHQLTALRELQQLTVISLEGDLTGGFEPLTALTALSALQLECKLLQHLPAPVASLPALQRLHCTDIRRLRPLGSPADFVPACMANLRALTLGLAAAYSEVDLLTRATCLTRLHIAGSASAASQPTESQALDLLACIEGLPELREVEARGLAGAIAAQASARCQEAYFTLLQSLEQPEP